MVWDVGTDAHMKSDEFSEKFQVGLVESKHLCCRFWTFEQGFSGKKCNMIFQKLIVQTFIEKSNFPFPLRNHIFQK